MRQSERKFNRGFGKFVELRRIAQGMDKMEFALRAGVSPAYLREIERGLAPGPDRIRNMAEGLGDDPAEWLEAAGYEPRPLAQVGLRVSEPTEQRSGAAEMPAIIGDVGDGGAVTWRAGVFDEEGKPMPNRFCLLVDSRAIGEFRYGTTILIESDRVPIPGSYVVVKDASDDFRLVRFRSRRGPQLEVESVGPFNPGQSVTCEAEIVGVATKLLDVPLLDSD